MGVGMKQNFLSHTKTGNTTPNHKNIPIKAGTKTMSPSFRRSFE